MPRRTPSHPTPKRSTSHAARGLDRSLRVPCRDETPRHASHRPTGPIRDPGSQEVIDVTVADLEGSSLRLRLVACGASDRRDVLSVYGRGLVVVAAHDGSVLLGDLLEQRKTRHLGLVLRAAE